MTQPGAGGGRAPLILALFVAAVFNLVTCEQTKDYLEQQQQQMNQLQHTATRYRRSPLAQPAATADPPSVYDGLCKCTKEERFLNVVCDFTQNKVS